MATTALSRTCARCFSTSIRASLPAPSSSTFPPSASSSSSSQDWSSRPVVSPQFRHVENQRNRDLLTKSAQMQLLMRGYEPDEVFGNSGAQRGIAPPPTASTSASSGSTASTSALSQLPESSTSNSTPPRPLVTYEIPPLEDPLLAFLTNMMMTDGKKAVARGHVSLMLSTLRHRLSSQPLPQLREAIRLVAPNVRMAKLKKGSKQVGVPRPLGERQRVRQAIVWILDASDKRKNPVAGGSKKFGERVALEVEAILNGTSTIFKTRNDLHQTATVNRANVPAPPR